MNRLPSSRPGQSPAEQAWPAAAAAQLGGTVSVITGGGRGIGRVLAQALAGAGAAVGLIARSGAELAETVRLVEAACRLRPSGGGSPPYWLRTAAST